jgi:hypothetical protein
MAVRLSALLAGRFLPPQEDVQMRIVHSTNIVLSGDILRLNWGNVLTDHYGSRWCMLWTKNQHVMFIPSWGEKQKKIVEMLKQLYGEESCIAHAFWNGLNCFLKHWIKLSVTVDPEFRHDAHTLWRCEMDWTGWNYQTEFNDHPNTFLAPYRYYIS